MHDLVIRRARPWPSPDETDLAIDGARFAVVAPRVEAAGREEWNVGGRIVLPPLVDPHHHLDKACLVGRLGGSRDLADARARFRSIRSELPPEDLQARGDKVIGWAAAHGVGALRTHADVDATIGLKHAQAGFALKARHAQTVVLQVVAFQPAAVHVDDEASWAKLAQALDAGCEAVGASTGTRGSDTPRYIDRLLRLAAERGRMVDLHLDETLEPGVQNLVELARLTEAYGLQGRVTASHCCSLAVAPSKVRAEAIERAARAGVHVIALPLSNLYLLGAESGLRGVAPVKELLAAGVNVACGSDNVQDAFMPLGNADPLLAAQVLGLAAQLADTRTLIDMVTWRAARAMGLEAGPDWCRAGTPASFAVADCAADDDPLSRLAARPLVVREGRIVRRPGEAVALPPLQSSAGGA